GTLHDALAADVDPAAGRHLAVHHQALAVEFVEVFPGRPVRHQVGVGDQHARRVGVGGEHAHRLARLHQQGLVVAQRAQRVEDRVVAGPVARGAADAAVDHQVLRAFGHVRVEVVLQHPERRLGEPAAAGQAVSTGRADAAGWIVAGVVHAGNSGVERSLEVCAASMPAATVRGCATGPIAVLPAPVRDIGYVGYTLYT